MRIAQHIIAHHFKQRYKPPVISPITCTTNLDNSPVKFSILVRRFPTNKLAIFSFHLFAFTYKMRLLKSELKIHRYLK